MNKNLFSSRPKQKDLHVPANTASMCSRQAGFHPIVSKILGFAPTHSQLVVEDAHGPERIQDHGSMLEKPPSHPVLLDATKVRFSGI